MIVDMEIYSPRWGHDDTYKLELEQDRLVFRQSIGPRPPVIMNHREHQDPEWENLHDLHSMFVNDQITAPEALPRLFEHLWRSWRNNELTADQVHEEAAHLANYINATTKAKPQSDFWRRYF